MSRFVLAFLSVVLASGCGGSSTPPLGPPDLELLEGFESGLGTWTLGFELPEDPNRPGEVVEWSIEASTDEASEGLASARFRVDGTQDDATIWIVQPLDGEPNALYRVDLSFELWSLSGSANSLAAAAVYAGAAPPAGEADFDVSQLADQAAGWVPYAYVLQARADGNGRVFVALGITVLWETQLEYYIDDVRIELRRIGP